MRFSASIQISGLLAISPFNAEALTLALNSNAADALASDVNA
jgi:hypothetical protein